MKRVLLLLTFVSIGYLWAWGQDLEDKKEKGRVPKWKKEKDTSTPVEKRKVPPGARLDVSEEELETFTKVAQKVLRITRQSNREKMRIIRGQGLSLERYKEIVLHKRHPQKRDSFIVTEKEQFQFEAAQHKLEKERKRAREKIRTVFDTSGIERQRYERIKRALRVDPKLQERYYHKRKELAEKQEQSSETEDE